MGSIKESTEIYYSKIKKDLDNFSDSVRSDDLLTSVRDHLLRLCKEYENKTIGYKNIMNDFDTIIIQGINKYIIKYNREYNKFIENFQSFISRIEEKKNILEDKKRNYFESSKIFYEIQDKLATSIDVIKENEISNLNTNLRKTKNKLDLDCNIYKKEIDNINNYFNYGEVLYKELIEKVNNIEKGKYNFLVDNTNKISKIIQNITSNNQLFNTTLINILDKVNIERDIKLMINRFNFYNTDKKRFVNEQFLNYDYINNSIQEEKQVLKKIKKKSNDEIDISKATIKIIQDEYLQNEDNIYCNVDINDQLKECIKIKGIEIFDEIVNEIINSNITFTDESITKLMNDLNNKKNVEYFVGCLYSKCNNKTFTEIKDYNNFKLLSNLLSICITNNIIGFPINYLILYIAEKSFYQNSNGVFNKVYLCNLLSENILFKDPKFWTKLIEIRIAFVLDQKTKLEIQNRDSYGVLNNNNVITFVKSFVSNWRNKENKQIENQILYNQLIKNFILNTTVKVIEDYITHFSNFKFPISDAIEIIIKLSLKYNFDREYVNLFNAMLNTTSFSIKTKKAIIGNIEQKVEYKKLIKYISPESLNESESNINMILIANSLYYSTKSDLFNILLINKEYYNKFKKIVFSKFLLNNNELSIHDRVYIWKILLNYKDTINKYNYNDILNEIKLKNIKTEEDSRDIIELDVSRTPFEINLEENRKKILNILRAVCYKSPNTKYCQGMNYIASFILLITESEQEAFYLYLSLLRSTEYGELFINDLSKLKKYFFIFGRLLHITMPELYYSLMQNNITVSYFVSPWFITLFTNTHQYIKNNSNPIVLLRIWDFFLLDGWNSILQIGISLIKHFELKLLTLPFEELLQFLIGNVIKSDFFQNENIDTLMFINHNLKIDRKLLLSIENEYIIKSKLNLLDINN